MQGVGVMPLMMNRQYMFSSSASWACASSKFPSLSFDRFWWVKVGVYDRKNQEAGRFWRNADLTKCQAEHLVFGSGSVSGVADDVDDEDAVNYLFD